MKSFDQAKRNNSTISARCDQITTNATPKKTTSPNSGKVKVASPVFDTESITHPLIAHATKPALRTTS
jgi:hypothetical protein